MSKFACERGSSKRKKATAKADALRPVIEKTKPITQFIVCQKSLYQGGEPAARVNIWNGPRQNFRYPI